MHLWFSLSTHKKFIDLFQIQPFPRPELEWFFIEKTKKYLKIAQYFPWLQMVAIWNSIAMNHANKESDIDLFIVTSENTLWLNRILFTILFQIYWVRKNNTHHAGRFCLSFFVTLKWMDFSTWKIENDIYLYFWIVYLKPILNYNHTYENFIQANSSWADFSLYKDILEKNNACISYQKNTSPASNISSFFNTLCKNIFLRKTLNHYKKLQKPYGIIINDTMLKFHNNDIRKDIQSQFNHP